MRKLGSNFGSVMTGLVEEEAARRAEDSDMSESEAEDQIKSELEEAPEGATLSRGIINSILRGDIECPFTNANEFPTIEARRQTFSNWAEIVDSTQEELISAAEQDGCDYSTDSEEEAITPRYTLTIE